MATLKGTYWTAWEIAGGSTPSQYGDIQYFFKIYEEVNTNENTSTMRADCYARVYTHTEIYFGTDGEIPVSLRAAFNGNYQTVSGNATVTAEYHKTYDTKIGTITYTVSHNTDGSGTVTNQNSGKISGSSYIYTSHQEISLAKIDRGTSISSNADTSANKKDFGANVTFTLTKINQDDIADVYYQIDDNIYSIVQATSETSLTYQFPTSLISSYPANTEISLTVYCKTLSNNTVQKTTVYLSVPINYVPAVSLALSDTNEICSGWGIYVKLKSILEGVITASGVSNSTIIGYSTSINNNVIGTATFITNALNPTIPNGESSTTMSVVSTVTDTRGRSNSDTKVLTIYDYFDPTFIKCELKRCNQDGTLNSVGTYAKVICQYRIAPCNSNNVKKLTVTCGEQSKIFNLSNYEATITADSNMLFSGFDIDTSYTFTFTLEDSFTSYPVSVVLRNSYITRSFKAGGKGITFGQDATEDGFNCYMDANFKGDLKHNNVNLDGKIKGQLLWTNSSPTTSFEAQTITLATNTCNVYEIYFNVLGNSNYYILTCKCEVGKKMFVSHSRYDGAVYVLTRVATLSQTNVEFDTCYQNASSNNSRLIPMYVVGYTANLS